jgi:phenylacetate-CoA ligase
MFIVRGVNVFPLGVQEVLYAMRPDVTGEFRILLERAPPIDYDPLVQVEQGRGDGELIAARVHEALRRRLGFTPRVELVPAETFPRSERKSQRLFRIYEGDQP